MKGFVDNAGKKETRMIEAVQNGNALLPLNVAMSGQNKEIINTNADNQLKASAGILRQIMFLSAGTTWNYEIQDGAGFQTGAIPIAAAEVGKVMQLDLRMGTEVRIITTGTTPGAIIVTWD